MNDTRYKNIKVIQKEKRHNYGLRRMGLIATIGLIGILHFQMHAQDEYWHQRVSLFDKLPVGNEDIVFLGNSITDGGEFQELFGVENVLNRGIRSDRISGVRKRLDQVTSGHPKKIFLLIGINDVANSRSTVASIADAYEILVKEIREKSPETQLYIQSIMPINNDFRRYKSLVGRESMIPAVNESLKKIADANGCVYIDLWPGLADPETGKLQRKFTNDGLHLTGAGYREWSDAIRQYVFDATGNEETVTELLQEQGAEVCPEEVDAPEVENVKEPQHQISIIKKKG